MIIYEKIDFITLLLLCLLSVTLILVYVDYRKLINALDEISKVFDYVRRGLVSERLHIRYSNELRKLSLDINGMITALQERDINIKEYQKELLSDIKKLRELDKIREDFSATLAHDLRVPILAEANTLKFFLKGVFGEISDKQKEALENMLESNNDLLNLVNTLLDVYKHDAVEVQYKKEITDIKKLVCDCSNEISSLAKKNNHRIINELGENLPLLNIDKGEIKRVVLNILNNAITYTPLDGEIRIESEIMEREEEQESEQKRFKELIIKISDNGKGIAQADIDKVFDRYFSKAMKFRKVGTGLGLYLSRRIIEAHGGRIWAQSRPDEGSVFFFALPIENQINNLT